MHTVRDDSLVDGREEGYRVAVGKLGEKRLTKTIHTVSLSYGSTLSPLELQVVRVKAEPYPNNRSPWQRGHAGNYSGLRSIVDDQRVVDAERTCGGIINHSLHKGALIGVGLITWPSCRIRRLQYIGSGKTTRRQGLIGHNQRTIGVGIGISSTRFQAWYYENSRSEERQYYHNQWTNERQQRPSAPSQTLGCPKRISS